MGPHSIQLNLSQFYLDAPLKFESLMGRRSDVECWTGSEHYVLFFRHFEFIHDKSLSAVIEPFGTYSHSGALLEDN